jgi:hypothetical protein
LRLRLPPGYRARFDPDVLALERADGSVVARFGVLGLAAEEVERAAWENYGEAATGASPRRSSGRVSTPYFSRSRSASSASPARMSAALMEAPSPRHSR